MADVTLRAYIKEIDTLIERDQLDEAIAHCRHILQVYPKHLETYRLLGKSYLEAKRFGDAADIFQRVLSAMPEDFVSHIGMAIVREDEGNLDAAIWHMERAFETNPANPAIRQELSRLIGRRDGLEPHKIRLTRGALARQYAQGELFPQAIAELRSALQEDPDRPDLEILLARMYWQSEQFDAAKTLCKQILEKLPFSYEANRVMAAIYQETNNPEKASAYHRRLAGLDPYIAFVDSAATDPSSVSKTAVRVDRSDWMPGQPLPTDEAGQPDWVSSLGVDLSKEGGLPAADSVPSWMSELEADADARPDSPSAFVQSETDGALSEAGDIPDWMREAGWEPSTGEVEERPVQFSDEELESLDSGGPMPIQEEERGDEEEIAPADIPDWLHDIAPSDIPTEPEPELEAEDAAEEKKEFVPEWLADISSESDDVPPEPIEDTQEVRASEPDSPEPAPAMVDMDDKDQPEVPTWVEDEAPGATSTIISWLGDRPESVPDEELTAEPAGIPVPDPQPDDESESPSWLDDLDTDEAEDPSPVDDIEDEEVPSWLAGVAGAASEIDLEVDDSRSGVEEPISPEREPEPATVGPEAAEPVDDDAWLRDLAETDIEDQVLPADAEAPEWAAEDEPEPAGAEAPSEVPDWLEGIAETEDGELPTAETGAEPEWLSSLDIEEETTSPDSEVPRQEVPDWLQGIAEPSATTEDATPEIAPAGSESDEEEPPSLRQDIPESEAVEVAEDEFDLQALRQFEEEISIEPDEEELPGVARSPEDIGVGEELDDEEVYQWLESLAQEQESDVDIATEAAVSGIETVQAETKTPIIDESAPPEEPTASLDWLEDLASERGLDVDVTPQEDASQIPATEAASDMPESVAKEDEEEAPDWLREMASSPSDETVVAPRPPELSAEPIEEQEQPEEIPGWLDEATSIAADVPAEPAIPEAEVAAPDLDVSPPQPQVETTAEEVSEPVIEPAEPEERIPTFEETSSVPEEADVDVAPVRHVSADEPPTPPESTIEPALSETSHEQIVEPPAQADIVEAEVEAEVETAAEPEPEKAVKFEEPLTEPTKLLQSARQALSAGDAGRALSDYHKLIKRKQDIETVITDLQRAAERYPNLPKVWQALGDAYMNADQLPEAIKAYKRGMEVA